MQSVLQQGESRAGGEVENGERIHLNPPRVQTS
jgi:hypothetical protein